MSKRIPPFKEEIHIMGSAGTWAGGGILAVSSLTSVFAAATGQVPMVVVTCANVSIVCGAAFLKIGNDFLRGARERKPMDAAIENFRKWKGTPAIFMWAAAASAAGLEGYTFYKQIHDQRIVEERKKTPALDTSRMIVGSAGELFCSKEEIETDATIYREYKGEMVHIDCGKTITSSLPAPLGY